jgi:hypothetical protein
MFHRTELGPLHILQMLEKKVLAFSRAGIKQGLVRDLNPGPLAPEARIIPLNQRAMLEGGFGIWNSGRTERLLDERSKDRTYSSN